VRALIWVLSAHPGRALQRAATRLLLGVRCGLCGDYVRGPRTLERHVYVQHGDV
jgi:hypothetical protein